MAKFYVGQDVFFIDGEEVCEGTIDTAREDSQGTTYTLEDLPCRFEEYELFKTSRKAKEYLKEVMC